jgi:hypothetical protein
MGASLLAPDYLRNRPDDTSFIGGMTALFKIREAEVLFCSRTNY